MALSQRGEYWYGEEADDIRPILNRAAGALGGTITHYADAGCPCGGREFGVVINEGRACVVLDCEACGSTLHAGPGPVTIEDDGAEAFNCPCGGDCFEVCAGVSELPGRKPRRLLLGCRCALCGLVAGYSDWPLLVRARQPIWRPARGRGA